MKNQNRAKEGIEYDIMDVSIVKRFNRGKIDFQFIGTHGPKEYMPKEQAVPLLLDLLSFYNSDRYQDAVNHFKELENTRCANCANSMYDASSIDDIRKTKIANARTHHKFGYVYLVRDNHNDAVKIGLSINLKRRFSQLGVGCKKSSIVPILAYESYSANLLELLLHDHYSHKMVVGSVAPTEWFQLSEKDIEDIRCLNLPDEIAYLVNDRVL